MNPLNEFPITSPIEVAWGEMDSYGHVNNAMYFRYFETARIAYFEAIGLNELKESTQLGPILAHTSCQFLYPLAYPHSIASCARVKSLGRTSFVMEFAIHSEKVGWAAKGDGVIVMLDYNKQEKIPVPASVIEKIEQLENRSFS